MRYIYIYVNIIRIVYVIPYNMNTYSNNTVYAYVVRYLYIYNFRAADLTECHFYKHDCAGDLLYKYVYNIHTHTTTTVFIVYCQNGKDMVVG